MIASVKQAVECLIILLSRKSNKVQPTSLLFAFDFMDFVASSITEENSEEDYLYHKRLTQMLVLTGTNHLAAFSTLKQQPESYGK